MGSVRRLIFHTMTMLSILLALAIGALWVRSYDYRDAVMSGKAGGALWAAQSWEGNCELVRAAPWFYDEAGRHFSFRGGLGGTLMFGNVGCSYRSWRSFYSETGRATWVTRPETGEAYRASEVLEGDFIFDDPGTGVVVVPQFRGLGFPLWSAMVLFWILPVWRVGSFGFWVQRRRARRRRGACVGCGYDLRASAGRCPECGRVIGGG